MVRSMVQRCRPSCVEGTAPDHARAGTGLILEPVRVRVTVPAGVRSREDTSRYVYFLIAERQRVSIVTCRRVSVYLSCPDCRARASSSTRVAH